MAWDNPRLALTPHPSGNKLTQEKDRHRRGSLTQCLLAPETVLRKTQS